MRAIILFFFAVLTTISFYTNANTSDQSSTAFSQQYPHSNANIAKLLQPYRTLGKLKPYLTGENAEGYARNILSWQLPTGGFGIQNHTAYLQPWDGKQRRSQWVSDGVEHGNFDDDATVAEVRYLAQIYHTTKDAELRDQIKLSLTKALNFIFQAQHTSGGWPQVYPERTNSKGQYSNHVTLNDHAMIRVMVLLSDILASISPFDSDMISPEVKTDIYPKLASALDFLLQAQIQSQGKLTIWAGQHNTDTYQPEAGRKYEPIGRSSKASAGVIAYLMNWPKQTTEVQQAVQAGLEWFQNNQVSNLWHNRHTGQLEFKQGKRFWYRFYEIERDTAFFSGRDGIKKYHLAEVEWERRTGYGWGGDYAGHILKAANDYAYTTE